MTAVERFRDMYEHYREAGDDDAVEILDAAWKHARVQSWELRQAADDEWVAGNALNLWTAWASAHRPRCGRSLTHENDGGLLPAVPSSSAVDSGRQEV